MISAVDTLPSDLSLAEACAFFSEEAKHRSYPVVDAEANFLGLVSRSDALRWQGHSNLDQQTLGEAASDGSLPIGYPDDTVGFIADMMIASDGGRVPILDRSSGKLVGLITRKDLLRLRGSFRSLEQDRNSFLSLPGRPRRQR
jgi:CIC family chloride channel protein